MSLLNIFQIIFGKDAYINIEMLSNNVNIFADENQMAKEKIILSKFSIKIIPFEIFRKIVLNSAYSDQIKIDLLKITEKNVAFVKSCDISYYLKKYQIKIDNRILTF